MPSISRTFVVESRQDFLKLTRGFSATFYELYSGTPDSDLERLFDQIHPDEQLLRFDMQAHSRTAYEFFCKTNDFVRTPLGIETVSVELPLPCFRSYVPPFGQIGTAWSKEEIMQLIERARKEKLLAKNMV